LKLPLTTRISLHLAVVVAVILSVFGAVEVGTAYSRMLSEQRSELEHSVHRLERQLAVPVFEYNREQMERYVLAEMREKSVSAVIVRDALDKKVLLAKGRDRSWAVRDGVPAESIESDLSSRVSLTRDGRELGSVEVHFSNRFLRQELVAMVWRRIAAIAILLLVTVATLSVMLVVNILRPVTALKADSEIIAQGNLFHPIDTQRHDELGDLARSVAHMRDTIREKIERLDGANAALTESEARFRSLLENAASVVLMLSPDMKIMELNPEAEKLYGLQRSSAIGKDYLEACIPESVRPAVRQDIELVLAGQVTRGFENEIIAADGSLKTYSWAVNRIMDSSGVPSGIVAIGQDIAGRIKAEEDRRALEARLHQAEKMEAIGQLAGGVAHDFNNQLAAIMGYSDILRMTSKHDKTVKMAEKIVGCAKRSAGLTTQLLSFARKGSFLQAAVDIHKVIGEVVSMLRHSIDKRINVLQVLNARHAVVIGDPSQLQNALLNIALNARDAMPNGGELMFSTDNIDLSEEDCKQYLESIEPGLFMRVRIRDTGSGMNEETLRRAFEPFFTTKVEGKGTGMGLAAVYGTITRHKGTVLVSSKRQEGSEFTVLIPASAEELEEHQAIRTVPPTGTAKLLLVEDESSIRDMTAHLLGQLGYEVEVFGDPREAVNHYAAHWADVDLVLLDLVMPGLSGREVFEAIRKTNPEARVLLVSGYSVEGDARKLIAAGASGFLQKPFEVETLSAAVIKALA
jgi:PAS domain S-box-containing protein